MKIEEVRDLWIQYFTLCHNYLYFNILKSRYIKRQKHTTKLKISTKILMWDPVSTLWKTSVHIRSYFELFWYLDLCCGIYQARTQKNVITTQLITHATLHKLHILTQNMLSFGCLKPCWWFWRIWWSCCSEGLLESESPKFLCEDSRSNSHLRGYRSPE